MLQVRRSNWTVRPTVSPLPPLPGLWMGFPSQVSDSFNRSTLVRLLGLWTIPLLFVSVFFFAFSATALEPRRSLTESGSLILKDVLFGDTAIYQCQASNKHGTILANTNVYVIGEYLFSVCSFFNRKCAVASYFSFLLRSRAASSDPNWEWEHVHLRWGSESSAGVWNLWLS